VELPPEGQITTDPIKVTRILDNLLSNAVRYTPPAASICAGSSPRPHCW